MWPFIAESDLWILFLSMLETIIIYHKNNLFEHEKKAPDEADAFSENLLPYMGSIMEK